MEVAESTEPAVVGAPPGMDTTIANGEQNLLLDDSIMGDDRSSSLSEIDDVSENIPSDYESPKPERVAPENDSEAETERIEDSPNFRSKTNIVVSAAAYEPSPSKLAQSTTYDDVEDEEEHAADDSPSKPRSRITRINDVVDETSGREGSMLSIEGTGKKRKRLESGDELGTEIDDDDLPSQKRRGSVKSDLSDPPPDDIALSPEPMEDLSKAIEEDTPADETPELTSHAVPTKGKRAKKGKRKGRKVRDADDDMDNGIGDMGAEVDDNLAEDDTAERGEDVDDSEAAAKIEEESAKRMAAMDSLAVLEREFATLRDKIYDERISKLNRELEMLNGPNPTHPEFLRQLDCLARYRDSKIKYEHTLFQYRIQALLNKSLAERAQAHSTYFQRARDIREKHSSTISKQFYSIQHDRFKTDDVSPQHYIPFPTRRSQQIAHQTAYNQEVSIMAGVAKYVGFPAAPSLSAARPSELEDDLEKMGISIETKPPLTQQQPTLPRGTMPAMSSSVFRTPAEEAFLEQTPWANPQHPVHQHQQFSQRPQNRIYENPRAPTYTTPAAQKRVVDIHAPNGSASTIAENSSANNTPFDQEQAPPNLGHFVNPDYDADRRSGFRSLSSSPLDVRKPHPASYSAFDHRSPQGTSQHAAYSPPSARLGLFQSASSKREPSPSLSSRPVNSLHQSAGILGGPGSNQMAAR
ncbi:transcriptional regulatory protein Dep1 [Aspergillus japonicus CBS 114.51]|uniref:Transcriptional regulatory protein Dep1 n=1 Tax=Aspergillus japonicus CBS 114.51 TaxID=1448312 RepID=A0A8T8WLM9_ASPJA|nr:transcriptional regulatory protein Dep1 [Aspergillus japonicus CBS 114.51]RAH76430.1 transcriptional regulatory protein Dep1 [Aspergillus japonicus CBS 114.51]